MKGVITNNCCFWKCSLWHLEAWFFSGDKILRILQNIPLTSVAAGVLDPPPRLAHPQHGAKHIHSGRERISWQISWLTCQDERFTVRHTPGENDWTLAIKFVNQRDQGVYVCQVRSSPSHGWRNRARLDLSLSNFPLHKAARQKVGT